MKFFSRHIIYSILAFLLFLFLILNISQSKTPGINTVTEYNIQNGDIIFRRGYSTESQAVILTDRKSRFSHVGIICIENGIPFVIHAVPGENKGKPDFIKKEKLTEFLNPEKASEFAIYRSDFSEEIKNRAVVNAIQFFKNKLTFDDKYDFTSDEQLYCTELILKAFQSDSFKSLTIQSTSLNFIFGKLDVILPGNIIENPHFFKIINH
jgi:hypothetical protein